MAAHELLARLESQPSFAELHVDASLCRKDLLEQVAGAPKTRQLRLWLDNGVFQSAAELAELLQACYERLGAVARQEKLPIFEDMSVLPNLGAGSERAPPCQFRGEKFDYVVLGGTFDRLHVGHKVLLTVAAVMAEQGLAIGVSGPPLLREKAGASILQDWGERAATVVDFLAVLRPNLQVRVEELSDAFGPALWPEMGALVVSAETEAGGAAVNARRQEKNSPQLHVVAVPLVASAGREI
ncbi:COAD [Symbiodinium sp. CCMP2592]|nr:COAD [Symbiodinium sp. CCMP2592]